MTDRFAFTTTSGEMDNSTVYVETLDPARASADPQTATATYYFLFNGGYQQMDRRVEVIHFAGEDSDAGHRRTGRRADAARSSSTSSASTTATRSTSTARWCRSTSPTRRTRAPSPTRRRTGRTRQSTLDGFAELRHREDLRRLRDRRRQGRLAAQLLLRRPARQHRVLERRQQGELPAGLRRPLPVRRHRHAGVAAATPTARCTRRSAGSSSRSTRTQGYLTNWNTKPTDQRACSKGNSHDEHWGEIYRSERIGFLLAHKPE